jgi:hypothetical protein
MIRIGPSPRLLVKLEENMEKLSKSSFVVLHAEEAKNLPSQVMNILESKGFSFLPGAPLSNDTNHYSLFYDMTSAILCKNHNGKWYEVVM